MSRLRGRLVIVLALAGAGIGAVALFGSPSSVEREPLGPGSKQWPKGTLHRYTIAWRTEAAGALAAKNDPSVSSEVDLHGVLAVRAYGGRGDHTIVAARFESLDRAHVRALGKDLLAAIDPQKDFVGQDALVELDAAGHVADIRFSERSVPLFRHLMRALVREVTSQAIATGDDPKDAVETALGRATQSRTRDPQDPRRFETARGAYHELEAFPEGLGEDSEQDVVGRGELKLNPDETIAGLVSDEQIAVRQEGILSLFRSKSSLALSSLGSTRSDLGAPPVFPPTTPAVRGEPSEAERRASLERRSAGVTLASVVSDIRLRSLVPRGGSTEWIWRDAAFLELHPELSGELVALGAGDTFELAGRAALFDLVVIAGTVEGQTALRNALSTWVKEDPETYTVLVQRLGHLAVPSAATADFMLAELDAHARRKEPLHFRACAYALGAIAGTTTFRDRAQARRLADRLVSELYAAKVVDDRVALLRGLGNAGFDEDVSALLPYAKDSNEEVRAAVAASLRKMEGEKVEEALVLLSCDADATVSKTAIASLLRQDMSEATWNELESAVENGQIPIDAQSTLVNELSPKHETTPHAAAVLVALLASPHTIPRVKPQIEAVLRKP